MLPGAGRCTNLYTQHKFNGHDSGTDSLEVPTMYEAHVRTMYVRESPNKIWPYMVRTYLHFRILKFPLIFFLPSFVGEYTSTMKHVGNGFSEKPVELLIVPAEPLLDKPG